VTTAGSGRVSSGDVARAAEVSRTTVSFVLNDHPNAAAIPEATRRRVLAAAQKLGYTPSPEARALRSGSSNVVLCLLPDEPIAGPFGVLLRKLSSELSALGLTMLAHQRNPGEDITQALNALTPIAVVAMGVLNEAEVDAADRRGIRVLSVMGNVPNREDLSGLKQAEVGGRQADELLRHGHTSLAYVLPEDRRLDWFGTPRVEGAKHRAEGAGGQMTVFRLPSNKESSVRKWVARSVASGVTGVCAYNDEVAFAVMMAASAEGLSVPEDISVIGVDDTPLSRLTRPALTTISFQLDKEAVRLAGIITKGPVKDVRPGPPALLSVRRRGTVRSREVGDQLSP
jgi:DNA-binding LacI/PurR family transcriptional regulator